MKKYYKYILLILVCMGNFIACFTQYQTSVMSKELIEAFNMTSGQFARLTTAQMIPTIFLSLVVGSVADKIGFKKTILIAMCITVSALFLKMSVKQYVLLFALCGLAGFIGTFFNTLNAKIISSEFDPSEMAFNMGLLQASLSLGQVLSLAYAGVLGYKKVFLISFIMAAVLFVLWLTVVKDRKTEVVSKKINLKDGLRYKEAILAGFILFALYGGFGAITSFLPKKLLSLNLGVSLSGKITSITAVARLVGALTFPFVYKSVRNKNGLVALMLMVFPVLIGSIALINNELILSAIVAFAGYMVGALSPILFALPLRIKSIDKENIGAVGGTLSMLQILGAVTVPSYICGTIAGDNYLLLYLIAGGISFIGFILYLSLNKSIEMEK